MRIPLEISFHGISRSQSLEKMIHTDIAKLEKVCDNLISCRVGIKMEQKSRRTANPFKVRIEMRMPPGHDLVVNHTTGVKEGAEDLPAAVKNAFKSAHRRLKQQVQKQRGEQKIHPQQQTSALVTKIFHDDGYGFIRSTEGEEIYFHKNSIVNHDFEQLKPGAGVRYTVELGEEGLQATSVQVIGRAGRQPEEGDADIAEPLSWNRESD